MIGFLHGFKKDYLIWAIYSGSVFHTTIWKSLIRPVSVSGPFCYSAAGLYVRSSGGAKRWRSRNIVF